MIGPAATVEEALELTASEARIDGAVLDINLREKEVYPVADVLRGRGVPASVHPSNRPLGSGSALMRFRALAPPTLGSSQGRP